MTPGADGETADGMSPARTRRIIDALRHERYRFQPVKRVYIPKKSGKLRPLGLPSWPDKIVGEVIRLLLEAYYEPRFSGRSHGFRPGRGCHTALREVEDVWSGTTWFIEGDVSDCFGSLDHEIMVSILAEKIHDNRFLRLMRNMLTAGYLEDWHYHPTLSGCPQGGVVSPVLSNIYLDRLDKFAETVLIPEYTRGAVRAANPEYGKATRAIGNAVRRGERPAARRLRILRRGIARGDPRDSRYRRLRYIRYADDHLLRFTGPKAEAEQIKQRLAEFLRDDLKLELNQDKTLITHARTRAASFLGYEVTVQHSRDRPTVNGVVRLRVPQTVIKAKCAPTSRTVNPRDAPS
jgi:group II intron reverse transcriptase/maturase